MTRPHVALRNGDSAPRAEVPEVELAVLRSSLVESVAQGGRVLALFGAPGERGLELWLVLGMPAEGTLRLARAALPDRYPAITPHCAAVHLFERELSETWGVVPEGHPWLKPVRFVRSNRPSHPAMGHAGDPTVGVMDFYRVEGDEVHEVAVGPVHAGVIEPGHFRFQCHGERVFHLEISLGYQHRGVEKALVGGPNKRTLPLIETAAGDTTIAHTTAHSLVVEGLAGVPAPPRAQVLRGVALELERLANHTGDLGALAGDVAYLPTAAFCGRIRGDWLNLTAEICGNRFGRGFVVPGGTRFDADASLRPRVEAALRDVSGAMGLLWDTPSVMARFEDTGRVPTDSATEIGLVGLAARASGLRIDSRVDFPTGSSRFHQIPIAFGTTGDVFGRAWVRALEIERSAEYVLDRLSALPPGPCRAEIGPLPPDRVAVAAVEGWRGEVCHVALTGPDARFSAYKVVDPSFHNWMGLAMALRDEQISDFPLCNKSFNLSYCGHDL